MVSIITEQERTGLSEDDIRKPSSLLARHKSWRGDPWGLGASEQVEGFPAGRLVEETAKRSGAGGGAPRPLQV